MLVWWVTQIWTLGFMWDSSPSSSLQHIPEVQPFLSPSESHWETCCMNVWISSCLDWYNALPKVLYLIKNFVMQEITRSRRKEHITPCFTMPDCRSTKASHSLALALAVMLHSQDSELILVSTYVGPCLFCLIISLWVICDAHLTALTCKKQIKFVWFTFFHSSMPQ